MDFSEKFSIIQKELKLSQKDFAAKIELSPNAISQYMTGKRKPDVTTIQKLLDLGVSPLFLFCESDQPFDESFNLFKKARLGFYEKGKLEESINSYLLSQSILKKIYEKIQRIKGRELLAQLSNLVNGNGERMLILLYTFSLHLEKNKVLINSEHIKFNDLLKGYKVSYIDKIKHFVWIKDKDYTNLMNWAENELDEISLHEFIFFIPEIKEFVKSQLNVFDKTVINTLEKLFK